MSYGFLCGFCQEKVNKTEHGCEVIQSLKEKFNSALSAIQQSFEKRTSGMIHCSVLQLERQVRETWQAGMEAQINSINRVLFDLQTSKTIVGKTHSEEVVSYMIKWVNAKDLRIRELEEQIDILEKQLEEANKPPELPYTNSYPEQGCCL